MAEIEEIRYWRVKKPPTEKQMNQRDRLADAAKKAKGVRGTVWLDGKLIPKAAKIVKDELSKKGSATRSPSTRP